MNSFKVNRFKAFQHKTRVLSKPSIKTLFALSISNRFSKMKL